MQRQASWRSSSQTTPCRRQRNHEATVVMELLDAGGPEGGMVAILRLQAVSLSSKAEAADGGLQATRKRTNGGRTRNTTPGSVHAPEGTALREADGRDG